MVLEYARAHPETLVLVTADHSQAAQLVPETSVFTAGCREPGLLRAHAYARRRRHGRQLRDQRLASQEEHTGADVPLFAYGPVPRQIPASIRQTEIFGIMLRHLGLEAPAQP